VKYARWSASSRRWAATRSRGTRRRIPSEVEKSSHVSCHGRPDWGGSDLKSGTVRAIVRQLGLSWEAFTAA